MNAEALFALREHRYCLETFSASREISGNVDASRKSRLNQIRIPSSRADEMQRFPAINRRSQVRESTCSPWQSLRGRNEWLSRAPRLTRCRTDGGCARISRVVPRGQNTADVSGHCSPESSPRRIISRVCSGPRPSSRRRRCLSFQVPRNFQVDCQPSDLRSVRDAFLDR